MIGNTFDKIKRNFQFKVVHSQSKNAWNVVGTVIGSKYKIARFPYIHDAERSTFVLSERNRKEQLINALLLKNAPIFYGFIKDNIDNIPEEIKGKYPDVGEALSELDDIINS